MSWLDGFRHRLRTVLRPGTHARELDEEIRFHLELDALQQKSADLARRRFGNRTYYQEEVRLMTWLRMLDFVRQDLRYACRSVARAPGFASLIALTLALAIGVNTATFSVLDELYLRPPAGVADAGSLRRMWLEHIRPSTSPFGSRVMSYPVFRAIAEGSAGVAELAARTGAREWRIEGTAGTIAVNGVHAAANFFDVVGVRAALGRIYSPTEDRFGAAERVAVVSHHLWTTHLGGDPAALERPVLIDGKEYLIAGVLQRDFRGIDLEPVDVWVPLGGLSIPMRTGGWWDSPSEFPIVAIARLAAPALEDEVRRRASLRVQDLHRTLGRDSVSVSSSSIIETHAPGAPVHEIEIAKRLAGVALIVLVIACANVMNLFVARAIRRRREIAVRLALGISRWRLVRLLTMETLVITAIATAAALLAGWWGSLLLRKLVMPETRFGDDSLHVRVLVFTMATALIAGLLSGIFPALRASRASLATAIKDGGSRLSYSRSWLRKGLVVAQSALSVVLLVGAGLFVRSLGNVQALRIGFDADRLVYASIRSERTDRAWAIAVAARLREMTPRLESMPGVEAVGRADNPPMMSYFRRPFWVGADSAESFGERALKMHLVASSFFRAAGMRMERGKTFAEPTGDGTSHEVVVNEAAARLLWRDRDAIGQCIRVYTPDAPCRVVVGVVENARLSKIMEPDAHAQLYMPVDDTVATRAGVTLIVRTDPRAASRVARALHLALREVFPDAQPEVRAMTEFLEPQYRPWRLGAALFTGFGLLALLVAVVGIHSTMSYGVSQRVHEFGVRIALGARIGTVVRQVVGESLRTVAVGVLAGTVLALALARLVSSLLHGVAPGDPAVLVLVALALLAAAALAAAVPAWRAARIDPASALRAE